MTNDHILTDYRSYTNNSQSTSHVLYSHACVFLCQALRIYILLFCFRCLVHVNSGSRLCTHILTPAVTQQRRLRNTALII